MEQRRELGAQQLTQRCGATHACPASRAQLDGPLVTQGAVRAQDRVAMHAERVSDLQRGRECIPHAERTVRDRAADGGSDPLMQRQGPVEHGEHHHPAHLLRVT